MQLRPPSPALIVASLALALSAGGAGYAAATIGTSDLANNAVTSPKVKNGTLKTSDLSKKALASLQGATGPAGAPGHNGAAGAPGAPGTAIAYGFVQVTPTVALLPDYTSGIASVTRTDVGTYCLTPAAGVSFAGRIPTFGFINNIAGSQPRAYWDFTGSGCATGALKVKAYISNTTVSDNVAFTVVIS